MNNTNLNLITYILDCFILGCKLAILIEELLCVFTDSQMKAALHYIDSLAGVVKKSTHLSRRKKAIRKLEVNYKLLKLYFLCILTYFFSVYLNIKHN